ncbi:MAG TPA: MarR family transcriptional regulator [Patescibacteria group bacterium]|nr:MarR family transcriptional regulator [Patescibacteria group bacterium]
MPQTDEQTLQLFIEKMSVFFGVESRLPRSVARIIAFLLVSEPPQQTAEQLAEKLKLSTGAVSGAVSVLQQVGLVKRVTFAGDRRYYYESDPAGWKQALLQRLKSVNHGIALAEEGMKISKNNPRLQAMHDIYAIFETEFETLIKRLGSK